MTADEARALISIEDKRAICDRMAAGKASTRDFERLALPFEAFLRYAQQSPDQWARVAAVMRARWGIEV